MIGSSLLAGQAHSTVFGLCDGDSGFTFCADYSPSGCINLSDFSILVEIYNTNPNKNGGILASQGEVWLSGNDESTRDCILKTEGTWDAAIVRFKLPVLDPSEIIWSPSRSFIDRSILVSNKTSDGIIFSLFILGSGESGTIDLGSLTSETFDALDQIEFLSTEIGSSDKSLNVSHSPVPIFASLGNASPNPFNPMTTISFSLPRQAAVSMVIYDVSGRLVRTLMDGEIVGTGPHEKVWNGRDDGGKQVAAGVYFYRLDAGRFTETKRMALVK